jgi:non-specific protein-tyrosine kinase
MKLRKALEKAKETRGEEGRSAVKVSLPAKETRPASKKRPEDDWKPPVYSESLSRQLDTKTVMNNRCVCIAPDAPQLDSYKVLRTKIHQMTQEKGWNSVMITSPYAGEGKTLTSINLALTFSKAYNQTVLLVDGDLRNQNIHKVLGFESSFGLIDYLVDSKPMQELIIWPGIEKLTLISGGRTIHDSTELLASERMKTLVQELKSRYRDRYVIFDVAPVLVGADALALAPFVDAIVMVVEQGQTSMRDVNKALEVLPQDKFLGFVMNRQKDNPSQKYQYYPGG